jgi:hypothetical protein
MPEILKSLQKLKATAERQIAERRAEGDEPTPFMDGYVTALTNAIELAEMHQEAADLSLAIEKHHGTYLVPRHQRCRLEDM